MYFVVFYQLYFFDFVTSLCLTLLNKYLTARVGCTCAELLFGTKSNVNA